MSQEFYFTDDQNQLHVNFHPGQVQAWESRVRFVVVTAGTQSGKALALDTPIPTPTGFVKMGDLAVGDQVIDSNGNPCRVTYCSPVFIGNKCYRVVFDDGESVIADKDHLWLVQTYKQRKNEARWVLDRKSSRHGFLPQCSPGPTSGILTTEEISKTLMHDRLHKNYSVPLCRPLDLPAVDLPIAPYTLGAWLGDGLSGSASIVTADLEILENIQKDGYLTGRPRECNSGKARAYTIGSDRGRGGAVRWNPVLDQLRNLNLIKNKHIPEVYFTASFDQRLALLQGLMDTDGYVGRRCEFSSISRNLATGVKKLACSLGIKVRFREKTPLCNGKKCRTVHVVAFSTTLPVFRLGRKLSRIKSDIRSDAKNRYIARVDPVASVPTRCITVDSPDSLYLCGESYIPTHNTAFGPWWLWREIQMCGPGDYFVATPSFRLLSLKALPEFKRLFEKHLHLGRLYTHPQPKFVFSKEGEIKTFGREYETETNVLFGHAQDPESLESATAKAAWLDEAGQKKFKLGSFEAILRRLSIAMGRVLITTTPYNLGWLKKQMFDPWDESRRGGRVHPEIEIIRFDSTTNPAFPEKEYIRAKRDLPSWKFNMFYRGFFERPAGLIYDCWAPSVHKIPRFKLSDTWPRYLGLDFGGVNTAGVFLAKEPTSGNLFAYREYHAGARTAKQHVAELLRDEPCLPISCGGAGSEDQWRAEFAAAGLPVLPPVVTEVEVGINRVYAAMQTGKLYVFDDLVHLVDEIETYSRPTDEAGNVLEGIEDKEQYHRLDAMRYIVSKIFTPTAGQTSRTGGKVAVDDLPGGVFGKKPNGQMIFPHRY